ncbi:MAG: autotransporter outer membrane beta-barrel domain-containing protein, partial [Burkholderiales bacterium]|nr:autotransporter outer membrane beta-barrel domain-containing protein [Burkholderiales bacterium]
FTYIAFGNAGISQPILVNVTIEGRPDPGQDRTVAGILDSQAQAARRFARAQIGNYQRRLETLHATAPASDPKPSAAPAAPPKAASAPPVADPFAPVSPRASSGFVPVSLTATPGPKQAPASAFASALAGTLVGAAGSGNVDLGAVTGAAPADAMHAGTQVWMGGLAHFGKRGGGDSGLDQRFSTDGLSLGFDRRVSERLVLGLGLGYGRDRTDVGDDGSRAKSSGMSFAGYGSYQPSRGTFIDAVLGFGRLDMDSDRYVASHEAWASAQRDGRQFFGSLAAGYEMRREGLLLSPYGRVDFTVDKLDAATESGAGPASLVFHEQTLRSTQAAAGVRLESRHETDFGWAVPRARLEYRHEFESGATASISYADLVGGTVYSVSPAGSGRDSLLFGLGADFLWRKGTRLSVDYQGERTNSPGTAQAIRFLLSQDLAGRMPSWPSSWSWKAFTDPVNVEAGFAFDDNVSRGRLDSEKRSDQVYSFGANTGRVFPINPNLRAQATALLSVDKFHDNTGLGRTSGGLQGELQYRSSGDFDAVIWAVFARGWIDAYESKLRSGSRLSAGANARRSLTDRIDLFGEVGANWRRAESAVFEGREFAGRLNLDYSLGPLGTAYLTGEYRRGDTFASGFGNLWNLNNAEVFVRDDAFEGADFFAYRFEARTLLGTLGYNWPLGPRDSLDFSYRRVRTTPLDATGPGPSSYDVNQYAILYLMRF